MALGSECEKKINLWVAKLVKCEVITVNKAQRLPEFSMCYQQERPQVYFLKNNIHNFPPKIQEIYRHRNTVHTCD